MLRSLTIRNVVLIDRLDLEFEPGLGVLTGETGSGKSILLDALGLALGVRADSDLVSSGADQGSATAEFEFDGDGVIRQLLDEHGLAGTGPDDGGGLVLRRVISENGRSRAFINDQPVSVSLMRQIGEALAEVHGQLESHGLLDPSSHAGFVDAFGGHHALFEKVQTAYRAWREAESARRRAEEELEQSRKDEEFLRHAGAELAQMEPRAGEEESLAKTRSALMHGEQLLEALNEAAADLARGDGADAALRSALQRLERVVDKAAGRFDAAEDALGRALIELNEAHLEIERALGGLNLDPKAMEDAEERLFGLRALARKHNVAVDELPRVRAEMEAKLAQLNDGTDALLGLERDAAARRENYLSAAAKLTKAREKAARTLKKEIEGELPALKLEKTRFDVRFDQLDEGDWGAGGVERLRFEVQTNPNTAAGPIGRVASGGELARIMLAIKVVLADADAVPTIVFDEVDTGIGGAAAAAVGERLARLAQSCQVLVVTHSPQVAARGMSHWRVTKEVGKRANETQVANLGADDRIEEIARMLAGARVTDEARAAATRLIEGGEIEGGQAGGQAGKP